MIEMKIIKTAKVEIIKSKDLKVGDYILWSNFKCKVVEIFTNASSDRTSVFAHILQFDDDEKSIMQIPKYKDFYKILDSEEIILCNSCFNNQVVKEGDWCKECEEDYTG